MARTSTAAAPTEPVGSAWQATGIAVPEFSPLARDITADVAIIGGGFTGLAAARDLAGAGVDCVVVEARDIGWGASGRNGGFAVPRYKLGFAALGQRYGTTIARRLHALVHEAIDTLEATVADYAIDCEFVRCGHLTAAHSARAHDALAEDAAWLRREAGDEAVRLLDADEVRGEVGGGDYVGGYLDPRGAAIHPLNYVRGLARGLADRGVAIHCATTMARLVAEAGAVVVETDGGTIRARRAIVATNAHTPSAIGAGKLHRRIVAVSSSVVATAPLSQNLASSVMPGARAVSDTRRLMHYFRRLPDDRVVFGGRGDVTGRRDDPAAYRGLERALVATFPALADTPIEQRWSGRIAVTRDHFPHVGRHGEGVLFGLGYNGRGVALSNLVGRLLARMARGVPVEAGPISDGRFAAYPFHAFRLPAIRLATGYYAWQDARGR